jgi:ABC-type glycerol-3-phosphate transport system permease component
MKNKPDVWTTRLHLVIFYSIIATATVTGLYAAFKRSYLQETFADSWLPYILLLCSLGVVLYLIYLLRFNVFKRFGNLNMPAHAARQFVYLALAGIFLLLPTLAPNFVDSIVAHRQVNKTQLVADVNKLNLYYQMADDGLAQTWRTTYVQVIEDSNDERLRIYIDTAAYQAYLKSENVQGEAPVDFDRTPLEKHAYAESTSYYVVDKAERDTPLSKYVVSWRPVASRSGVSASDVADGTKTSGDYIDMYVHRSLIDSMMQEQDSVAKISPTKYVFCTAPDLRKMHSVGYHDDEQFFKALPGSPTDTVHNDLTLWHTMLVQDSNVTEIQYRQKFTQLASKYMLQDDFADTLDYQSANSPGQSATQSAIEPFARSADQRMGNILDNLGATKWHNLQPFVLGILVFSTLFSVLLIVFRHSTIKVFWLSVLVAVLLTILTVLISTAGGYRSSEDRMSAFYIFYLLVSLAMCFGISVAKVRSTVLGIGLNLCVILFTALPLFVLYRVAEYVKDHCNMATSPSYSQQAPNIIAISDCERKQMIVDVCFQCSPYFTFLFMLIMMVLVFIPTFKKWYSQPEN